MPLPRVRPGGHAARVTTETWTPAQAPPETLERGPVRLRRWGPEDLDDLYAAVTTSREHLATFMPWSHDYERAAGAWFLEESARTWADRTAFNYRICADALPGRVLGSAGLMARRGPGILEIGYWVRADAVRRGLAGAAAAALTDAGLALPEVAAIEICHDPRNTPSGRIPARLGYTRRSELVPGPPGREDERHVCWVLRRPE